MSLGFGISSSMWISTHSHPHQVNFLGRHSNLLTLLLAQDLWCGLGPHPRSHDGILAAHPPTQGALQLSAQGQLLQIDALLLVELDSLLAQSLGVIIKTVDGLADVLDLGDGAVAGVVGLDGVGRVHAISHRGARRGTGLWLGFVRHW